MNQTTDIKYTPLKNDLQATQLTASVFSDRKHIRAQIKDDATASGFRIVETGSVADILDDADHPVVDLILLHCTYVGTDLRRALQAFDEDLCDISRNVIVSTNIETLDDVYACFRLSNPHLLVSTGRAERMLALSRIVLQTNDARFRELTEQEQKTFQLMSEQITTMAVKLDRLLREDQSDSSAFRFESPSNDYSGEKAEDGSKRLTRSARPALPDPRLVRRIIRQRQLRARFFDSELFADPAWDILLDLTAARAEHSRVSVTSLCIASGVPPTTALRWISQMVDAGLLERVEDEEDKRRAFIALSDKAAEGMARYFAELGREAVNSA